MRKQQESILPNSPYADTSVILFTLTVPPSVTSVVLHLLIPVLPSHKTSDIPRSLPYKPPESLFNGLKCTASHQVTRSWSVCNTTSLPLSFSLSNIARKFLNTFPEVISIISTSSFALSHLCSSVKYPIPKYYPSPMI